SFRSIVTGDGPRELRQNLLPNLTLVRLALRNSVNRSTPLDDEVASGHRARRNPPMPIRKIGRSRLGMSDGPATKHDIPGRHADRGEVLGQRREGDEIPKCIDLDELVQIVDAHLLEIRLRRNNSPRRLHRAQRENAGIGVDVEIFPNRAELPIASKAVRLALDHHRVVANEVVDVVAHVLLHGAVDADVFTDLGENVVPRTADLGVNETIQGLEIFVQRLAIEAPAKLHRLVVAAVLHVVVELLRQTPLVGTTARAARARTLHNHLVHVRTHSWFLVLFSINYGLRAISAAAPRPSGDIAALIFLAYSAVSIIKPASAKVRDSTSRSNRLMDILRCPSLRCTPIIAYTSSM